MQNEYGAYLDDIIKFSELIQTLDINQLKRPDVISSLDSRKWFLKKTKLWFSDIPKDVVKLYKIYELLKLVENGVAVLRQRPRHGDFAPWHIFKLKKPLRNSDYQIRTMQGPCYGGTTSLFTLSKAPSLDFFQDDTFFTLLRAYPCSI